MISCVLFWSCIISRHLSPPLVASHGLSWSLVVSRNPSWSLVPSWGHSCHLAVSCALLWSSMPSHGYLSSLVVSHDLFWSLLISRCLLGTMVSLDLLWSLDVSHDSHCFSWSFSTFPHLCRGVVRFWSGPAFLPRWPPSALRACQNPWWLVWLWPSYIRNNKASRFYAPAEVRSDVCGYGPPPQELIRQAIFTVQLKAVAACVAMALLQEN